ncbi:MAG: CAP domain-containing protein [Bacteroidota bacterium]
MKTATIFRSLLVLFFSISLVSCSTEDAQKEETSQPTIALKNYTQTSFEIELLDLVNQDRVSKGLNALTIINEVSYLASTHDDYMISNGVASHDNFEQRSATLKSGIGAITVSENVASGFSTATSVMSAWNASPSHKANLEGDHSHYGLAVKADAAGKKYYTLIFIRK